MGAWCIVDPTNCTVKCIAYRATGQHQWVGSASVGVFPACTYNAQHPDAPWPKPTCCGSQPASPPPAPPAPPPPSPPPPVVLPGASGVTSGIAGIKKGAQGPVTGPQEPNPCAPAMSQRSDSGQLGFTTEKHLTMPRTGEFHSVRHGNTAGLTAEPPTTGTPAYSKAPDIRTDANGMITVADLPTGPGYLVFHSSDINEFGLRGDSVHPDGAWAPKISKVALLLLVAERNANTSGDDARSYLAFGLPSARPEAAARPRSGIYFDYDPDTRVLNIQHTDADGDDEAVANGVTIDGSPIGGGSSALTEDTLVVLGTDTPDFDDADQWVLTSASDVTLGGIDAPTDATAPLVKSIINGNATYGITFPNGGGSNTSTGTGGSYTLAAGQKIVLHWSPTKSLWYIS